jgi:hypothetical protein
MLFDLPRVFDLDGYALACMRGRSVSPADQGRRPRRKKLDPERPESHLVHVRRAGTAAGDQGHLSAFA